MIYAGTRPPDRAERARARAERAQQAHLAEPADGPPDVGRQRAWNQPLEGAIDIVIDGILLAAPPPAEGLLAGEERVNL